MYGSAGGIQGSMTMNRKRLLGLALVALLAVIAADVWLGPSAWRAYAVARIESAKRHGIYADPVAGMREKIEQSYRDIARIEIVHAGTNSFDGRQPHVWFVTARVYAARRGDGKALAAGEYDFPGSFFLHVDDGWVHLPEGSFPRLVGRAMERFELYGCDAATGNCR